MLQLLPVMSKISHVCIANGEDPMKKRDLKLNSISRYSKNSQLFVLEEHGHCEVPAGWGGVVLRWTNPNRALPAELWIATVGKATFYLDGKSPSSGRPMIEYGRHVLGFHLTLG